MHTMRQITQATLVVRVHNRTARDEVVRCREQGPMQLVQVYVVGEVHVVSLKSLRYQFR